MAGQHRHGRIRPAVRSGGERHLLLQPVDGRDTDFELFGGSVDADALRERAPDTRNFFIVEWRSA